MEKTFIKLLENFSLFIKKAMIAAYVPLEINTKLSWGVIVCGLVIFSLTIGYNDKRKMNSGQLITLIATYVLIMFVLTANYMDMDKFVEMIEERSISPPIIILFAISVIFILAAWLGSSGRKDAGNLICVILVIPVIVLVLSNGRILYEVDELAKDFFPRFRNPFDKTSARTEKISLCCKWLEPKKIEEIINSHPTVSASAVFIYQDENDGEIKPYAFIEAVPKQECSEDYLRDTIVPFVKDEFYEKEIERYQLPVWFECVSEIPKTVGDEIRRSKPPTETPNEEIEKILAQHPAVAETAVISYNDGNKIRRICAFMVLEDGEEESEELQKDIRKFAYEKFSRNSIGPYLTPSRIEFVPEIPKTETVKRYKLKTLLFQKLHDS